MLIEAYLLLTLFLTILWTQDLRRKPFVFAGLLAVLAVGFVHQWILDTISEDAFITYRYSQNLADGHGAVFNIGERVEGYSNFLFMIILAGVHYVSAWPIPEIGCVAGIFFMLITLVLIFFVTRDLSGGRNRPALFAVVLAASSGTFVGWAPSGMETSLYGFLLLLALYSLFRNQLALAGGLTALATMTRPEGVLMVVVFLFWSFLRHHANTREGVPLQRRMVGFFGPFIVLTGAWTIWRVSYYGHLLPNPIAAKSGMDPWHQFFYGLRYLADFTMANAVIFLLIIAFSFVLFKRRRHNTAGMHLAKPELLTVAFSVVLFAAFYTKIGGDWMPMYRFYSPIIPLFALLVGMLFDAAAETASPLDADQTASSNTARLPQAILLGSVAVAGLMITISHPSMLKRTVDWRYGISDLEEIGTWMREAAPREAPVATLANGMFSYTLGSEFNVLDVLGLTDEHIARNGQRVVDGEPGHIAHDWQYVAERRPGVIFLSGYGFDESPEIGLIRPEFEADYVPVSLELKTPRQLGRYLNLAVRKDFHDEVLASLLATGALEAVKLEDGASGSSPNILEVPSRHLSDNR